MDSLHDMGTMKDLEYSLKYGNVLTIGSWHLYNSAGYWYIKSDDSEPQVLQTPHFDAALLALLNKAATITEQED